MQCKTIQTSPTIGTSPGHQLQKFPDPLAILLLTRDHRNLALTGACQERRLTSPGAEGQSCACFAMRLCEGSDAAQVQDSNARSPESLAVVWRLCPNMLPEMHSQVLLPLRVQFTSIYVNTASSKMPRSHLPLQLCQAVLLLSPT